MSNQRIDDAYLRDFFGIRDDAEGRRELADIRRRLERVQFDHNEDICTIDQESDGMYFLESGTAVVLDREGEQINVMRPGSYFGEYAVLSGRRRLSTVRSVGKTVALRLTNEDMMVILQRHPDTYGDFMKRVYGEVSRKHAQLLTLSRLRRGILQHPRNEEPMTKKRMLLQYGLLALVFILSLALVPKGSPGPVFLLPLALMAVYVLVSRRTLESLVVSGLLAAALYYRSGLSCSYADALMATMGSMDNVFTVLVMALMGSVVTLIEASGAVTAFKKLADRKVKSVRGGRFALLGIMAVTAIDDGLNMLCGASGLKSAADEQRVPREETGLMLSFLPIPLCSFLPFSLWGIFVIGTIRAAYGTGAAALFTEAIPFNFFTLVSVLAMLLFCLGVLPRTRQLKEAQKRVQKGGNLWPEGSERYLTQEEGEVWGRIANLLLPVAVLALASLAVRSLWSGSLLLDSACGLVATLVFMFFLYCAQGLMSPEQFAENLVSGIQSMALPILLYLLTICLSTLLDQQAMGTYFDALVGKMGALRALLPAVLFLVSTLLTVLLGSSWAMYAIAFPVAVHMASAAGVHLPLAAGAVCAAGIAGELICPFTSASLSVGNAIGCDPRAILKVRLPYSLMFAGVSFLLYLAMGFLF